VHPRVITEGYELAKKECLKFLEEFKVKCEIDKPLLISVARTSLNTKLPAILANQLVEIIVDAVNIIQSAGCPH
jgi:T-complex protein 1 subunit zeta